MDKEEVIKLLESLKRDIDNTIQKIKYNTNNEFLNNADYYENKRGNWCYPNSVKPKK